MIKAIPLFSGSDGNCTLIECDDGKYLVDAGMSCRCINSALSLYGCSLSEIKGVFITHEHTDHVCGLETICKKYSIPVYINGSSANMLVKRNKYLEGCAVIKNPKSTVCLPSMTADVFKTPHDACGSVGYRFSDKDTSLGYATDIGFVTKEMANHLLGCEKVIFEANHDEEMLRNGPYPQFLKERILSNYGHLSNENCAKFLPYLIQSGAKSIVLAHLSKENNRPALALSACEEKLAQSGMSGAAKIFVAKTSVLN